MDRRAAKELLHVRNWLDRVAVIVTRGRDAYLDDLILQEAGDSLMMKLGEAANRLARLDMLAPDGVDWALAVANQNFIIHQYEQTNRAMTWRTLAVDLSGWASSLRRTTRHRPCRPSGRQAPQRAMPGPCKQATNPQTICRFSRDLSSAMCR
ncbi:MAG: hypothetical protein L0H41_14460 [Microlunatus sp.]|nr:hypothetical protein [Microlunatus sp.]